MRLCAKLNDITYVRRFSRRCAENFKSVQDRRKKIHEVVSTGRSNKIFHFLAERENQTQTMFGRAEKALINNFLISVVYNSIFSAALEV